MVFYYPVTIPEFINKNKLNVENHNSYNVIMMYSEEGIFEVKKDKLSAIHFIDDEQSRSLVIDSIKYRVDNSILKRKRCNKIPHKYIQKNIVVTCYQVGSVKLYIEEGRDDGKISQLYFVVRDDSVYGIHDDIQELMRKVLNASLSQ